MSWIVEEELSELEKEVVEAEYNVTRLLERIRDGLSRGVRDFSEEEKILEDLTSPLINYPCKTLLEMVKDELRALRIGLIDASSLLKLVDYVLEEWRTRC